MDDRERSLVAAPQAGATGAVPGEPSRAWCPRRRKQRAHRPKLSTYSQGNPQKLSTGVEIAPAARPVRRKIASSGGQIRVAAMNYTLVSY